MANERHPALLWSPAEGHAVECELCNFRCRIPRGGKGRCMVRQNIDGKLYSLNYGAVCATHVDPIEKKPLFHFQPGKRSFSLACVGCNFRCDFCQNWQISQWPRMRDDLMGRAISGEELVNAAVESRCSSIAYTYTEPTIFMELCDDTGRLAKSRGLANVFVSNGYMTLDALELARDWLDAINVDLKAFSDDFYRKLCKASLKPVLQTLDHIANRTDIWLEVTTLIVPGLNDTPAELEKIAAFIADDLGVEVPWHISRFHGDFERSDADITPARTLELAYELGKEAGLRYVYVGNMPGGGREDTHCHKCGQVLIGRMGYGISQYNLMAGKCTQCRTPLAGRGLDLAGA